MTGQMLHDRNRAVGDRVERQGRKDIAIVETRHSCPLHKLDYLVQLLASPCAVKYGESHEQKRDRLAEDLVAQSFIAQDLIAGDLITQDGAGRGDARAHRRCGDRTRSRAGRRKHDDRCGDRGQQGQQIAALSLLRRQGRTRAGGDPATSRMRARNSRRPAAKAQFPHRTPPMARRRRRVDRSDQLRGRLPARLVGGRGSQRRRARARRWRTASRTGQAISKRHSRGFRRGRGERLPAI